MQALVLDLVRVSDLGVDLTLVLDLATAGTVLSDLAMPGASVLGEIHSLGHGVSAMLMLWDSIMDSMVVDFGTAPM